MDAVVFGHPACRARLDQAVVQALGEIGERVSLTKVLPLDWFGAVMPPEIRLCRLYILRKNTRAPRERHPNSVQTVLSYRGAGQIHVERNGTWVADPLSSGRDSDLGKRWHVVPHNTWHFPEALDADWVTLAFHSASETEIVDEVPGLELQPTCREPHKYTRCGPRRGERRPHLTRPA